MEKHYISPDHLTIDCIHAILKNNTPIALSDEAKRRIQACRDYLDKKMENQKEPIYGVSTGFGSLCNISVGKEELSQLQKNLVMSHACGTGDDPPLDRWLKRSRSGYDRQDHRPHCHGPHHHRRHVRQSLPRLNHHHTGTHTFKE